MWADKKAFFLVIAILAGALGLESALLLAGVTHGLQPPPSEQRLHAPGRTSWGR